MRDRAKRPPRVVLLAILGMLSLFAISCGPPPEPTESLSPIPAPTGEALPGAQQEVRVTVWHPWKKSQAQALARVIAAFQEEQPGVQIDVRYFALDDLRGTFEAAAALGEGPAVLLGAADWGPALYDAGWVADLSGIAPEEFLASLNPAALEGLSYRGALIGLPQRAEGVVLFRNPSIVAEAPATMEELLAAAQAATEGEVVGAHLERGFFFSGAHLEGMGGELMDGEGNPQFNSEKGVEWVELLRSFEEAGPVEYYTNEDLARFEGGQAGLIIDWTRNISRLVEAVGEENLAIDPWPGVGEEGRLSGYVQTENLYLSAGAEGAERAAAWAFMAYFLSPEAQEVLGGVGHIPAATGVELANPLLQQAADALQGGTTFPLVPELECYWEPMDGALMAVFEEGTDPAAALSQANNSIVLCIEEMRGAAPPAPEVVTGTISLWHPWSEPESVGLNRVIAAFQELHPGVQIDVRYFALDNLRAAYEAAAATEEGPAVLLGASGWGPALYDAGWVADVTGLTSAPFLASLSPAALEGLLYRGALIGLPQRIEGVVLFRNSSIVTETPATMEELVAAAQAATEGEVVGAHLERGFFFSGAHLEGMGGELMDGEGNPQFNSEKGVEWVELLRSFEEAGPVEYDTDEDLARFEGGQAGLIIDWTRNISRLVEAVGEENLAIDPWPAVGEEGRLSGYVQTENLYLSVGVEAAERAAAWAFMTYFLSPEAQEVLGGVGHIPVTTGVELANPILQQAAVALQGGTTYPVMPEMEAYLEPMDVALRSIFDEGVDLAAALQQAHDSTTAALERIRGSP